MNVGFYKISQEGRYTYRHLMWILKQKSVYKICVSIRPSWAMMPNMHKHKQMNETTKF